MVDVSVRRPIGVLMIVIAVVSLGLFSLRSLPVDLFPKIDLPLAVVATSYTGAGPEEVEKLVTRPLEASMSSLQGIDTLQSQSQADSSLIILMFKTGTNLDNALLEVREKVDQVKGMLPEDANDPSVLRFDPQQLPILSASLSGQQPEHLQDLAENTIVPYLERQKGVASVSVQGGKTREIQVVLDQPQLHRYGVSASQVVQALGAENRSSPVGSVAKGAEELQIRVQGEFVSLDDLRNTLIHLPGGGQIKVSDVAEVYDTFAEQSSLTYVNGEPALLLSVQKQSDANTVETARAVNKAIEELRSDLPQETKFEIIADNAIYIQQSINSVINNMLSGGALAVAILLLFLRSARSTLVIGLSIPIAVISTFTLMFFTGQTLNMISMGGLALGIGMMVDSSIVILENIFSYRQRGLPIKEAAVKGASELGSAVIASTLTTLVVFLPIVFVEGIASDIFTPMALGVSFSLIASLVVAITLVPMLASQLLSGKKKAGKKKAGKNENAEKEKKPALLDRFGGRVLAVYRKMLRWALHHRKTVIASTIALMIGSLSLIPFIGAEFFPASDQGQFQITVETPGGTRLEETKQVADEVEELLQPYTAEIKNAFVSIGGSNVGFGGSANVATFTVQLIPSDERERSTSDIVQAINGAKEDIVGAEVTVTEVETGLGGGNPIQVGITGSDYETLKEIADQAVWTISSIDGVFNPTTSASEGSSELNIAIDREIAARYGLTYQQIMNDIRLSMNGQVATQYREEGNEYNVKVILPEELRSDISGLSALTITSPTGQLIPLSAIGELQQVQGPIMIQRENQQRQINVSSDVAGRDLGAVSADVQAALREMNLPDGYAFTFGGQSEDMIESFTDLAMALVFSIFLVYIVMAVQFESVVHPFVIMFALPTTMIGVLIGMFVTQTPLSMTAFIGLIILAGIVVNNAIILVDYINILRRRGLDREEAILQGGPSRMRPIFMTMLTTVLGLVPLALGIGEGAEMQAPLAITVIFGLTFSTVFTLLLIPVMYTISDDFTGWLKRVILRRKPEQPQTPEVSA